LTGVYGERSTWVALHNCIGTRTEEVFWCECVFGSRLGEDAYVDRRRVLTGRVGSA
jgi:hypothetical protein